MKKNMVRILAFVLVLILALGIIPLGALAVEVNVNYGVYDKVKPTIADVFLGTAVHSGSLGVVGDSSTASVTIKTSDYTKNMSFGGKLYDLNGILDFSKFPSSGDASKIGIPVSSSVTYTADSIPYALLVYGSHQHKLSYWYSDNTTHWRECLTCKKYAAEGFWEQFMFQNWHSDGDEDRVCDVCGHDIPYHEIDVEEVKGGKITVELDEAPYRKKIVATAEPEEGYKLKKIHFIKVRDNGTEQEITRRKTSTKGTWWTYMPTYDLKVTAEFVKKK